MTLEVKYSGDTATITGYASAFGPPADQSRTRDIIAPGAFSASVKDRLPEMRREHKGIVGTWRTVTEDEIGLRVTGTVTDAATVAAVGASELDGLSIGFVERKSSTRPDGGRTLEQVDLLEISLVRRPAKSSARVLQVKSEDCMSEVETKETTPPADQVGGLAGRVGKVEATVSDLGQRLGKLEGGIATQTKSLDALTARLNRPGAGAAGNGETETKAAAKAFETFLRRGDHGLDLTERKSLRLADDESAGYLAPAEFVAEIDKNLTLFSPVRQVATVRNTSRSEVSMLRRTTPATATWVGEEEDRPETEIKYGAQSFPVRELGTYVDVSLAMLEDAAVDVAAELAAEFAEAFGAAEGTAFVTGNGIKRPMGFMSDADVGFTVSGSASAITCDGIIDLYHAVKPAYRPNGVFMANGSTIAALRKLKAGDGHYLVTTAAGVAGAPATTLLGRPIIEAPDMPDIGAGNFPVIFGDFGIGYRIFDRIALSVVRDDLTQRTKGKVRFHGRRRVAGGVRRAEAIRKLKIAAS